MSSKNPEEQISIIKNVIDEADGKIEIVNFILRMGTMMFWFGICVSVVCAIQYYMLENGFENIPLFVFLWTTLLLCFAFVKTVIAKRRSSKLNITLFKYFRRIMNKNFMHIDIPIELAFTIVFLYFVKNRNYSSIIPMLAAWPGILFSYFGSALGRRSVTLIGYGYLALFAVTLLFFEDYPLENTFILYGLYSIVVGFSLRYVYRKSGE